jgi:hypothetical protein
MDKEGSMADLLNAAKLQYVRISFQYISLPAQTCALCPGNAR